jgi:hypothetical protein
MLEHHHHLLAASSFPSGVASLVRGHASRSLLQETFASRPRFPCPSSSFSTSYGGRYDRHGPTSDSPPLSKTDKEVQNIVLMALAGQANNALARLSETQNATLLTDVGRVQIVQAFLRARDSPSAFYVAKTIKSKEVLKRVISEMLAFGHVIYVFHLLEHLQAQNIAIDLDTFELVCQAGAMVNALIRPMVDQLFNRYLEAKKWWPEEPRMHLAALYPFARHQWLPQVLEIMKEIERLRIPLNPKICTTLAVCFAQNQKPQEALAYGKRVLDLTGQVSGELMTGLAPMLASVKQCDEALMFYEAYKATVKPENIMPRVVTAVMRVCIASKELDKGLQVFRDLQQSRNPPEAGALIALIVLLARHGLADQAMDQLVVLRRVFSSGGHRAVAVTDSDFLSLLRSTRGNAELIHRCIRECCDNLEISTFHHKAFLQALVEAKKRDDCYEVFKNFTRPTPSVYEYLMSVSADLPREVLKLARRLLRDNWPLRNPVRSYIDLALRALEEEGYPYEEMRHVYGIPRRRSPGKASPPRAKVGDERGSVAIARPKQTPALDTPPVTLAVSAGSAAADQAPIPAHATKE